MKFESFKTKKNLKITDFRHGIYKHFKGDFYKATQVVYMHDSNEPYVVYYKCSEDGIFRTILGNDGITVPQPFIRDYDNFMDTTVDNGVSTKRFKFIKECL